MNPTIFLSKSVSFRTRQNYAMCTGAWRDCCPLWHPLCHVDRVTPEWIMWLMHKSRHVRWCDSVRPIELAWLVHIKGHRHIFLPPLFIGGGSIGDFWFPPPYEVCGALNRLHELVSRSYWVRMLSLPVNLVVFQFFLFGWTHVFGILLVQCWTETHSY
jgi:hypothetical protein